MNTPNINVETISIDYTLLIEDGQGIFLNKNFARKQFFKLIKNWELRFEACALMRWFFSSLLKTTKAIDDRWTLFKKYFSFSGIYDNYFANLLLIVRKDYHKNYWHLGSFLFLPPPPPPPPPVEAVAAATSVHVFYSLNTSFASQ